MCKVYIHLGNKVSERGKLFRESVPIYHLDEPEGNFSRFEEFKKKKREVTNKNLGQSGNSGLARREPRPFGDLSP